MIRAITESSHWALRRAKYVTWKFRVWYMCPAGGFVGLLNEQLKSGLLERLVGCFGHRWRFSNERSSEDSLFNLSQVFWNWAIRFNWQAAMKLKFAFENTKRIRLKRIIQLWLPVHRANHRESTTWKALHTVSLRSIGFRWVSPSR